MTFPSATIIFTSVNKHNILPCLARKLREVFSDQVTSQDRSQEPEARLDDILAGCMQPTAHLSSASCMSIL